MDRTQSELHAWISKWMAKHVVAVVSGSSLPVLRRLPDQEIGDRRLFHASPANGLRNVFDDLLPTRQPLARTWDETVGSEAGSRTRAA